MTADTGSLSVCRTRSSPHPPTGKTLSDLFLSMMQKFCFAVFFPWDEGKLGRGKRRVWLRGMVKASRYSGAFLWDHRKAGDRELLPKSLLGIALFFNSQI